MPKTYILICRQEDDATDVLTELERIAVPPVASVPECGATTLEHLESQAIDVGHQVTKKLLGCQWQEVEQRLVDDYQALFPPRYDPA
jgi:hypothetical protein